MSYVYFTNFIHMHMEFTGTLFMYECMNKLKVSQGYLINLPLPNTEENIS